jgi:group I intron endonuclease
MGHYFSLAYLERHLNKGKSQIYAALLKYGYSSFSLEIASQEYCERSLAVSREQYYIDSALRTPEYNILKKAGSSLGYRHSEETLEKLKAFAVSSDNLVRLKIFNASLAQKERIRIHTSSEEHKEHLKRIQLFNSQSVIVLDTFTNETTVLPSIREAARSIGSSLDNVRVAIKGIKETGDFSRLVKKRYKVKPYDSKS